MLAAEPEIVMHRSGLPSLWVTYARSFQNSGRQAITFFDTRQPQLFRSS